LWPSAGGRFPPPRPPPSVSASRMCPVSVPSKVGSARQEVERSSQLRASQPNACLAGEGRARTRESPGSREFYRGKRFVAGQVGGANPAAGSKRAATPCCLVCLPRDPSVLSSHVRKLAVRRPAHSPDPSRPACRRLGFRPGTSPSTPGALRPHRGVRWAGRCAWSGPPGGDLGVGLGQRRRGLVGRSVVVHPQ
jgi:hypothetical protein